MIEGARVVAKIVNQFKAKKIIIQKFRRRKNMRRRNGHRQPYTMVQITSLVASGLNRVPGTPDLSNHQTAPDCRAFRRSVRFFYFHGTADRR